MAAVRASIRRRWEKVGEGGRTSAYAATEDGRGGGEGEHDRRQHRQVVVQMTRLVNVARLGTGRGGGRREKVGEGGRR